MNLFLLSDVSADVVLGGAERVLREQARGLRRAGHDVHLLVRQPVGDPRATVTIGDIVERRYPVARGRAAAFLLTTWLGSRRVYDETRRAGQPDAVIVHQSTAGLAPILLRRRTSRAWVYLCHSLAHEEFLSRLGRQRGRRSPSQMVDARLRRLLEGLVMRRCDRVVVLSAFMRERVHRTHRIPPDLIDTVPGAADGARFHPAADRAEVRRALKLPLDRMILFTVRNLVPRMGLDNLLDALRAVGPGAGGLQVVVAGEGPLRPWLEQRIGELHLEGIVHLVGFVPEAQLPRYYQAADLVLMPTRELEGFGLVTVEALACGTPVLGTAVGAIPEVLRRVDPELIAEGSDPGSLARGIERLLRRFREDPAARDRLGERGRGVVARDFTWPAHTRALLGVLDAIHSRRGPRAEPATRGGEGT